MGLGIGVPDRFRGHPVRGAVTFNPPFWAHTYTAVLGVVLLVQS